MEKLQRKVLVTIIIMVILAIICIIALLIYLNLEKQRTTSEQVLENNEVGNTFYEIDEIEANTEIRLVDSQSQYYSVIGCIENYYKEILDGNNQKLYDILDIRYVQNNSITQENVIEKSNFGSFTNTEYMVKEMYTQEKEDMYNYYIQGYLKEHGTSTSTYFVVFVDIYNATYSIYPINYEFYNDVITSKESINSDEIQKNENNLYKVITINDETTAKKLLEDYQYQIENNIQLAYEKLDSEYRQNKFTNIEEYSQYINNIGIKQAKIAKYQKTKEDNYTQYVILDENGRYYVFKESSVMNYTVLLDIYTIKLPQFIENYNSKNEAEKVQYNLQLWFSAINDEDYRYAYNKLDETYRNNNFPTQTDFKSYIRSTFYINNKLGYKSYENKGEVYIYDMVISNYENENQSLEKQFVVKLLEGTDFVMSFEK